MALSDLELLSLVERAQEAKQGPIGPQGVGIRSIEQPDPFTVVISLTDGRTKEINLTAGPKGDPGEAGKPGRDGAEGRPGRAGKDGAAGVGVAGAPGPAGTSIDTAIVNGDGNLLLGLTDGNVLNVGRVVGPAGATGPTGPTGLPGRAGRDGNTILSGPHAPADNEGSEGDFWIDTSSPLFDFYAKGGSGWRKLTSLRAPQTPVGGKMSSGGGMSGNGGSGGGGELQNTATLPLANPSRYKNHGRALPPSDGLKSQKDLNEWVYSVLLGIDEGTSSISVGQIPPMPSEVGMLWFSTNEDELTLFIYVDDESGWVPAAPPVSLDGINTTITGIEGDLIELHNNVRQVKGDIVLTNQDLQLLAQDQTRQDEKIAELEGEVDDLKPTVERGEWVYNSDPESTNTPAPGEYHAYVIVDDDYCKQKLGECLLDAAGDSTAASKCNRDNEDCLKKIDELDTDVPWHEVQWIVVHRNDIEGRQHLFGDVVPGMYIEAINVDGTGHGLYQIGEKSLTGPKCGFYVTPVHSTGHPNGKAVIKIFKMAEAANPEDYIKKGTEENYQQEFLYGTRLCFKGQQSFVRVENNAWVGAYVNNSLKAKMTVEGLFSNTERPTSNLSKIWVPNMTQIENGPSPNSYLAHAFLWEYVEGGLDAAPTLNSNQFTYDLVDGDHVLFFSCYVNGQLYGPWNVTGNTADYGYAAVNNWNGRHAFGMWTKWMGFCQGGEQPDGSKKWWNELRGRAKYNASHDAYALTGGRKYYLNLPPPWPVHAFPEAIAKDWTSFEIDEPEDMGDPRPE